MYETKLLFLLPIEIVHERKTYECSQCERNFSTKRYLKIHFKTVHEGDNSAECKICNHKFATKSTLKFHVSTVHEGKKSHKCNICDTGFTSNKDLIRHIESVHEGKTHLCTRCGVNYSTRSHLNIHLKNCIA